MQIELKSRQIKDRFEVDFPYEVNFYSINELVRSVSESIDYQKSKELEINLNSPGGEYSALVHFVWFLAHWRNQGIVVKTKGLVNVASAAAMMLSLGSLGERRVYPHTELVYHFARLGQVQRLTANKAKYLQDSISEIDQKMLAQLVDHILPLVNGKTFPKIDLQVGKVRFKAKACVSVKVLEVKIKADLERLFNLDQPLTADQALQFYLVDEVLKP